MTEKKNTQTRVTHRGNWIIDEESSLFIECYVTNDARRLLSLKGAGRALELTGAGSTAISRSLKRNWIQPYLSDVLIEWVKRVDNREVERIRGIPGRSIIPLEGDLFVDICKAYVNAQKDGLFTDKHGRILPKWQRQYYTADKLFKIMSAFAKVGIVALIDEITGYQEDRERDELQKILRAYISEELLPWTSRFPKEFYKEMFRLKNWKFPPTSEKGAPRGPRYAGKLTKKLIYEKLPKGILEKLENRNPPDNKWQRKHKHHQWLTNDIGNPHLEKQVAIVTTLMRISSNWNIFKRHFARAFPSPENQLSFDFLEQESTDDETELTST